MSTPNVFSSNRMMEALYYLEQAKKLMENHGIISQSQMIGINDAIGTIEAKLEKTESVKFEARQKAQAPK